MIDTHLHLWDLNRHQYGWLAGNTTLLNKSYLWDEIVPQLKDASVTGTVLVQADNDFADTDFMLENATNHDLIKGVVGWLPLLNPNEMAQKLAYYQQNRYFKGIRHLIHDEKNPHWLLQPAVIESLKLLAEANLTYDIVGVLTQHLDCAMHVAEKIPNLRLVIDHLNKPTVNFSVDTWKDYMKKLSSYPTIYVKISGLGDCIPKPTGQWTANDIKPWIAFVIETFGVERCMVGGDYPVALLSGNYAQTMQNYYECLQSLLTPNELQKVLSHNAIAFYKL